MHGDSKCKNAAWSKTTRKFNVENKPSSSLSPFWGGGRGEASGFSICFISVPLALVINFSISYCFGVNLVLPCRCVPPQWVSHAATGSFRAVRSLGLGSQLQEDYCSIPSKSWGTSAGAQVKTTVLQGCGLVSPCFLVPLSGCFTSLAALGESQLLVQLWRLKASWL